MLPLNRSNQCTVHESFRQNKIHMIPAAFSSLFFCSMASRRASSSCRSLAFRLAFFPWVLARRARASDNISFSISKIVSTLRETARYAVLTVFVHVNGIRSSRLRLGVWINFSWSELPYIVSTRPSIPRTRQTQLLVLLRFRLVQQLLISFKTLRCSPTHNRRYRSPLCGHELRKMEKLFILGLRKYNLSGKNGSRPRRILTFDHSVFLMEGSNHSYHRALHCFGVFRTNNDDIRALSTKY